MFSGRKHHDRLRVAHVSATFPPYRGGTGNVCWHHARVLAARGHDVQVFTAVVPGAPAQETRDGVMINRLRPLVRVGNAPVLPQLLTALRGFDMVHLHCPFIFGAELTALVTALYATPLVITYHNDLINSGNWRDHVFRCATLSTRYMLLHRTARVLFVSEGHAQTCQQRVVCEHRPERVRILPNGIDTSVFRPNTDTMALRHTVGLSPEQPTIGFVGSLDLAHHYKGLEILLEAVATPQLATCQLLVVGDGKLRTEYQQQASQLNIGARVHFYGAADQASLPPLYQACDVVAMPSRVPESFGLVVAEALACGIPVVASDSPGVRSLIRPFENGLVVPPNDPAALANALHYVLDDLTKSQAMGREGRRWIEQHYDWQKIGAQLEQIYRNVLAASASRSWQVEKGR